MKTLVGVAMALALTASTPARGVVIDDFTTLQTLSATATDTPSVTSEAPGGIGGFREIAIDLEAGSVEVVSGKEFSLGRVKLEVASTFPTRGTVRIIWDGEGIPGPGLGGVDLTDGGASNAFALDPLRNYAVIVTDVDGNVSQRTQRRVDPIYRVLNFRRFEAVGGEPADLSRIDRIEILVLLSTQNDTVDSMATVFVPITCSPGLAGMLSRDFTLSRTRALLGKQPLESGVALAPGDVEISDVYFAGDFNGDGFDEVGRYVFPSLWTYIDANGNRLWEGSEAGDRAFRFEPLRGFQRPLIGDWNGDGKDEWGLYDATEDLFLLDVDDNGRFDGPATADRLVALSIVSGPGTPLVGDWNGDGISDVGKVVGGKQFILDLNGNRVWDGKAGGDANFVFAPGAPGTMQALVGDWNGDGKEGIALFDSDTALFRVDRNGNYQWEGNAGGDAFFPFASFLFQLLGGASPLLDAFACDWNGDGRDSVGMSSNRALGWYLDLNEDFRWRSPTEGNDFGGFPYSFSGSFEPLPGAWDDEPF